jgi:exodeoxyribonuclease-3
MKIVTWNIGGIQARKVTFQEICQETDADVVCIQETKKDVAFVEKCAKEVGYKVSASETYNTSHGGSAVFYKNIKPIGYTTDVPEKANANFMTSEARIHTLKYSGCFLISVYLPNTRKDPPPSTNSMLGKKRSSFDCLKEMHNMMDSVEPLIICGDFNVATYYLDMSYRDKNVTGEPGFYIKEQVMLKKFKDLGYVDAFRYMHPNDENLYEYLTEKLKDKKIGNAKLIERKIRNSFTLDYILVSDRIKERIKSVELLTKYINRDETHMVTEMVMDF